MSITYRSEKGSELEFIEVDENFRFLDQKSFAYVVGDVFRGPVIRVFNEQLYLLSSDVQFPFTASDFNAELSDGNWIILNHLTPETYSSLVNNFTTENDISDSDKFNYLDSSDGNKPKKTTWLNIKAKLKTAFDLLYQSILVSGTNIKTINGNSILGSGDLVVSGGGASKRTYYAEWKITGAMAASTSWYAQSEFDSLNGPFYAYPTYVPTNNFSNANIQSPCFILPFNAKIKSYNARGFTNGNGQAILRSIVNTAFTNTSGNTIQNALNVADVSFQLNNQGSTFRFQTDTGFVTSTLPKGTEIRLFNFNNNQNTPLQSTIISIEFEEVL